MPNRLTIRIVSSCTGKKNLPEHLDGPVDDPLTLEDFQADETWLRKREQELGETKRSAHGMYAGQQHERLMRAVGEIKFREVAGEDVPSLDLWILSAGYGLVHRTEGLTLYESSFRGMPKQTLREWSRQLGIPAKVRDVLAKPADLILVLLGDDYWQALDLDDDVKLGGPALFLCGSVMGRRLPFPKRARPVVLRRKTAKRFSCGLVGLKGELAARLLLWLRENPAEVSRLEDPDTDILDLLETCPPSSHVLAGEKSKSDGEHSLQDTSLKYDGAPPKVDQEIKLPANWEDKRSERRIHYFVPDWDDLVDPDYDFEREEYSLSGSGWMGGVFAHQIYDFEEEPCYDGILVSRSTLEKRTGSDKRHYLYRYGIHHYLRVPRRFPVLGDCGAFSYAGEDEPPFETEDVIDYYSRLGFDYGVSVDHLAIVVSDEDERQKRKNITLRNAEAFLREHRAAGLPWKPIGAVQGWTPETYADAAQKTVTMGYDYIAIGGIVRLSTKRILRILEAVHEAVPEHVRIHLFGIARPEATKRFAELGVVSVDSASPLRRAFLDGKKNYWTLDQSVFAAIRIPYPKRYVDEAALLEAKRLEQACLEAVRACDAGEAAAEERALRLLGEYHQLVRPDKPDMLGHYEAMLHFKPWKKCPCKICQTCGVEVAIFRGNDRNRRRGFHNTYVFYRLLERAAEGESINVTNGIDRLQRELFS